MLYNSSNSTFDLFAFAIPLLISFNVFNLKDVEASL